MKYATSDKIGLEICQMMGIDPTRVRRITIDLRVGEFAECMVETYADDDTAEALRHYRMVEIEDGE